ncbi:MAG: FAD-dependent oxidoreductase [Candidatus Paceibacterota bacterium]|jgi:NAD(P)H-nitrite reductase large subunit
MSDYKYLIIGGGVAGVTAAETIRQNDPVGSIAIVSDEPYLLYSRVMLSKPNFFLEKIPFDQIWLKGEAWYKEKNIIFLGGKAVNSLDYKNKKVGLVDGDSISYEKLLIAIGTATRKAVMPGADKKGVHYLRSLEDGKGIMENIKTAKRAVTVGGGFIGFEMADLMQLAGMKTTVVLREPYFWDPTLDESSGFIIEKAMKKVGIEILHLNEIKEITGDGSTGSPQDGSRTPQGGKVEGVILKDGTKIECEVVIFGIGTTSNLEWVKSAGLEVKRGIIANEFMETSADDVWTAGDITEYKDLILEENVQMGNWVSAHEQGRIAGLGMVNKPEPFKFVSFYTTQGFGISIAFVGDTAPGSDRVIISRGDAKSGSLGRIFIVGKELIGATLINRTNEMGTISKLIEKNIDVSKYHRELGDASFDLKKLLV